MHSLNSSAPSQLSLLEDIRAHHGDHLPGVPGKLRFTAHQIPAEHVAV